MCVVLLLFSLLFGHLVIFNGSVTLLHVRLNNRNAAVILFLPRQDSVQTHLLLTLICYVLSSRSFLPTLKRSFSPKSIFNIHVDVPHDPDSVKLPDLLQTVGLQQHIAEPTQIQGHTLDFLIHRSCDDVLNKANLVDRFISDHAFVYCALLQDRPAAVTTKNIAYRMPKAVDVKSIRRDLSDSLLCSDPPYMQVQLHSEDPRDLDALVRRYNTTRKTKTVKVSPAVPWYNNEIKVAKRLRRKAQGTWRRTRSLSDLNIFNPYRNRVTFLMNHTRQAFYTNFIDENSTDHKRLFRATKYLLAKKEELSFPNYQDKTKLANDIGVFLFARLIEFVLMLMP